MMTSFGSMNVYADPEMAYRRERIQRDFASINQAAQLRADRRARAAELRVAGQPTATFGPTRRSAWFARFHRTASPATR